MTAIPDLSDSFFQKWLVMADSVEADPIDLACVAFSESGMRASAANDGPAGKPEGEQYHASGLIQFMAPTLRGLGYPYDYKMFRKLTAEEQVPFVDRYFRQYRGKLTSKALAYVGTFVPAYVDAASKGGPDYVLVQKDGRLGWAYAANAQAFDKDRDYKITVREMENAIARNCVGARWSEIEGKLLAAMGKAPISRTEPDVIDVTTVLGQQKALLRAGVNPGPIDGSPGPMTRAAVIQFQQSRGLVADGVVGPMTRAALATLAV